MQDLSPIIQGALNVLQHQRSSDGYWHDFLTYAGVSTEWITGYVSCAFAMQDDPHYRSIASEAWQQLNQESFWRKRSGWGYHPEVPVDSDSTLWALKLGELLGETSPKSDRASQHLLDSIQTSGGLTTYASEKPIRKFTQLPPFISFDGWCGTHTCVTAAASQLEHFPGRDYLLDYLRTTQESFGAWISYWWFHHEYSTALAAEALATTGKDEHCVQQAVHWALYMSQRHWEREPEQRSVFATAYRVRILALAPEDEAVQEEIYSSTDWLIHQREADGCWASFARMRIPPPDVVDPQTFEQWAVDGLGGASIVRDQNAIFTTASVVMALTILQKMRHKL